MYRNFSPKCIHEFDFDKICWIELMKVYPLWFHSDFVLDCHVNDAESESKVDIYLSRSPSLFLFLLGLSLYLDPVLDLQ